MSVDPILVQAAFAIPISSGLVVYTMLRWDRSPLHLLLAALLTSVILWLGGFVLKLSDGPTWLRLVGLDLELSTTIFMPTMFVITMGHFARSAIFEENHAATFGLLSVSGFFLLAFLLDDWLGLVVANRSLALAGAHPTEWAGPVFWATQGWAFSCDAAGFGYCGAVFLKGRTPAERRRAATIFCAVAIPVLAHLLHITGWSPVDYTLAPGAIALTAIFFVQGVHKYGLLGGQTIVRHDVIEHLESGLLLTDEAGTILDANRAAERLIGLERAGLRGQAMTDVLSGLEPEDGPREVGPRILALPLDGSRIDAEIRTADDRILELRAGGVPMLGLQPAGRFVSLEDRTDQRKSERQLRERQKLESVGILAAGVAHEVNNPLAFVRANLVHLRSTCEVLPKDLVGADGEAIAELPEVLEESIGGLDRIARIVESMLRLARTTDDAYRAVDVAQVVGEARRLADLKREAAVCVERIGTDVPPVLGNADRLVQVVLNLFLNARQALAGRPDGEIVAETAMDGDQVLIRIADNGPGIDPDILPRIFDPFFTTRGPEAGTGLGLSIAFDIVREHGGTLEVESKPGEGARFTVRLAAAREAEG